MCFSGKRHLAWGRMVFCVLGNDPCCLSDTWKKKPHTSQKNETKDEAAREFQIGSCVSLRDSEFDGGSRLALFSSSHTPGSAAVYFMDDYETQSVGVGGRNAFIRYEPG